MHRRILVFDNSIDHAHYRPVDEWSRSFGSIPYDAVDVPAGQPVPPLDRYTHLLVTGSQASLSGKPEPWFEPEAAIMRDAVRRGLAVLGSCFGHQLLAWALSGPQHVRRAGVPELGWIAVDLEKRDPLFANVSTPWHTFAGHLDEVVDPPAPWRVLASTAACAVEAMRYGDRPVWGIQPHPETLPAEARHQMQNALTRHPEYADAIHAALSFPARDDETAARIAAAFLALQAA